MKLNLKRLAVLMCIILLSFVGVWAISEVASSSAPEDNFYQNTSTATFSGKCTGSHATGYILKLWINGSSGEYVVFGTNSSVPNNTAVSFTPTITVDQKHLWYWECMNSSSLENANSTIRTLYVDQTTPTAVSVGQNTPSADSYHTSPVVLNATCTDGLDPILELNWTVEGMVNNITVNVDTGEWNGTSIAFADGYHNVSVRCEDGSGYYINTTMRFFYTDSTTPVVEGLAADERADGGLTISFNFTETNFDSCGIHIYNATQTSTGIATESESGTRLVNTTTTNCPDSPCNNCSVILYGSALENDGYFEVTGYVTDSAGNQGNSSVVTNMTYVYLREGWNFIRNDRATDLSNFTTLYSTAITHVSLWSNINYNYTSYVLGVSTNEDVVIYDGDSIMVYSNVSGYLLRKDSGNLSSAITNRIVYSNWNTVSLYNKSSQTLTQANHSIWARLINTTDTSGIDGNASGITVSHISWLNPWTGLYETYNNLLTWNADNIIPYGYGMWMRIAGTHQPGSPTNFTLKANVTLTRGY